MGGNPITLSGLIAGNGANDGFVGMIPNAIEVFVGAKPGSGELSNGDVSYGIVVDGTTTYENIFQCTDSTCLPGDSSGRHLYITNSTTSVTGSNSFYGLTGNELIYEVPTLSFSGAETIELTYSTTDGASNPITGTMDKYEVGTTFAGGWVYRDDNTENFLSSSSFDNADWVYQSNPLSINGNFPFGTYKALDPPVNLLYLSGLLAGNDIADPNNGNQPVPNIVEIYVDDETQTYNIFGYETYYFLKIGGVLIAKLPKFCIL